ncbi:hypothetical protein JCM9534A_44250 [Catenuloplanes indicus JCM 9534]
MSDMKYAASHAGAQGYGGQPLVSCTTWMTPVGEDDGLSEYDHHDAPGNSTPPPSPHGSIVSRGFTDSWARARLVGSRVAFGVRRSGLPSAGEKHYV